MLSNVIIVGGGESFKTQEEYLSWLDKFELYQDMGKSWKSQTTSMLEALGATVIRPMMPNELNAKYLEWETMFNKYLSKIGTNPILIGHSLGGIFLPTYLSRNPLKVKALHLVAPVYKQCGDFDFDIYGYEPELIMNNTESIYIFIILPMMIL